MGDSDDEYDRKRRDKFRGERGGTAGAEGGAYRGGERRGEERTRGREDWPDRNRRDYREYRGGGAGGGRERGYSPGRGEGPPAKRIRGDWDEVRPRYTAGHEGYGSYGWAHEHYGGHHPQHQPYGHAAAQHRESTNGTIGETQPAMMSFKTFLGSQDDSITDDDAIKKYNEYKLEFRRQQLNEFFVAHKDEEWFKIKYHPEESLKRKEEQLTSLRNRLTVFMELLNTGSVNSVSVESDQSEKLIRLLDTVVIKLEGGDEEDLKVLDEKPNPLPLIERPVEAEIKIEHSEEISAITSAVDEVADAGDRENKVQEVAKELEEKDKESEITEAEKPESVETVKETKESTEEDSKDIEMKEDGEEDKLEEEIPEKVKPEKVKPEKVKKRKREYSSGSGSSSSSDSESEVEVAAPKSPEPEKEPGEEEDEDKKSDIEEGEEIPEVKEPEKKSEKVEEEKEVPTVEVEDENKVKEPRALHKTTSIFLRNLSPTITKNEVEAMCKRYTGYLRVAIADPLQERRWFRRGWLTFRREVNIKEICWNLNNIRLRECELGAIVNRDLSRRVRPVTGLTAHKQVVRADIKLCAKITHNLDSKASLWSDNKDEKITKEQSFGLVSKNPVLHNITDYLIEEASAEEDELLGLTSSADNGDDDGALGETIERDAILTKVLDKLILYLRIVHSVDFYNHCEYPYEDEMPNRCGIMHARGPPPSNKVSQNEIQEYIRMFESKMSTFLTASQELDNGEFSKLGSKDCEGEVEKFVLANTQELAKDKWLCPLSGKKFKGPDFIRKHIFNKHAEKVDEVKKEVEYFNNYLKDPKRPQLPEHPGNTRKPTEGAVAHHPPPYGAYGPPPGPAYGGRGGYHHPPYGGFGFQGYAPRPRGGFIRGRETTTEIRRPIVAYNDLDLPESSDYF